MIARQVTGFVRVTISPVTGSPILWQASTRPLADPYTYWDGFKQPLIEEFGNVERALSDTSGAYEVPTFSFVTRDKNNYWRNLLADPNTQFLTSSDVMFLLVSEYGRSIATTPRTGFRGQLESPALLPGKRFSIGGQSRLGTRYGPLNLGGPMLKRTYNSIANGGDFSNENFPRDNEGLAVQFLWGELSDKGTVNSAGEDISMGMMMPVNCGLIWQGSTTGTPPTSATYLPDPPAPTVIPVGSGGNSTWTFAASVRTATGHTRLGGTTTVDNLPSNDHFTGEAGGANNYPDNGATVHLAPYSATLMEFVTGADLWVKQGAADSSYAWHKVDAAGQMFNSTSGEYFSGPAGYMANGDDSFFKSSPPPPNTNTAQITDGTPGVAPKSIFYTFYGCAGATGKLIQIFGSDLKETPAYAPITTDEVGTDFSSGKHFILGPDGNGVTLVINGHTYFGFFAKGPKDEASTSGAFPFRVNMCGWHEDNNVALGVIDQAALVYADVFAQLGGNNGMGYQTGARLATPTYATFPTIPVVKTSTFFDVQEITKTYLADDKGYIATVFVDDLETTWEQFIQDMNVTFFFDIGETCDGQLMLSVMDDTVSASAGEPFREFTHILQVDDAGTVIEDEIENYIQYEYDWHPIDDKYRSGILTLKDDVSISKIGQRSTGSPEGKRYTRDKITARDATGRKLADRSVGPMYPAVTLKQRKAMQIELGNQILLEHSDLITSSVPLYVRRHTFLFHAAQVSVMGRDRRGLSALPAAPNDTVGNDYSDATPEEQATYMFATDDDGLLPDGTMGSRVR